jgi:hypothetical protein
MSQPSHDLAADLRAKENAPRSASAGLLSAALAGLFVMPFAGCGEETSAADTSAADDTSSLPSACECPEPEPAVETKCSEPAPAASSSDAAAESHAEADAGTEADASTGHGAMGEEVSKITSQDDKTFYTFAQLRTRCDERGGYMQIHATCGGVNSCKGFSYGDWGPDSHAYTEHSCSGANYCKGFSCIVLPVDAGKTGQEVYTASCGNGGGCHGGDDNLKTFKVFVLPGSTRNAQNWLELSAKTQEAITAFGKVAVSPEGVSLANMAGYHEKYSRKEIERVVAFIRTMQPEISVYDTYAPQ